MKKSNIFWGIVIIGAAVLIILDSIVSDMALFESISLVRIILGLLCAAWAISSLIKNKLPGIFFPLAFMFMLFEPEIAGLFDLTGRDIMSNWLVLLVALLLTIGSSLLMKPSHKNYYASQNSTQNKTDSRVLGSSTKYIDCNGFTYQLIINKLGSYDVYFENINNYVGDAVLEIDNDLGSTTIHVPYSWHIKADVINSLGAVSIPTNGNPDGPQLEIRGKNNLGSVSIVSE